MSAVKMPIWSLAASLGHHKAARPGFQNQVGAGGVSPTRGPAAKVELLSDRSRSTLRENTAVGKGERYSAQGKGYGKRCRAQGMGERSAINASWE